MIGVEDSRFTFEYKDYYKILPAIYNLYKNKKYIKYGKKVGYNFSYSSDNNKHWMKKAELLEIARSQGLSVNTRSTKAQIIEALSA